MRECAKLMGGKLTVWSPSVFDTGIELSIPAARANADSLASRRAWSGGKLVRQGG